jgi:hypothetical protein
LYESGTSTTIVVPPGDSPGSELSIFMVQGFFVVQSVVFHGVYGFLLSIGVFEVGCCQQMSL